VVHLKEFQGGLTCKEGRQDGDTRQARWEVQMTPVQKNKGGQCFRVWLGLDLPGERLAMGTGARTSDSKALTQGGLSPDLCLLHLPSLDITGSQAKGGCAMKGSPPGDRGGQSRVENRSGAGNGDRTECTQEDSRRTCSLRSTET
jgi:hypothetical protein